MKKIAVIIILLCMILTFVSCKTESEKPAASSDVKRSDRTVFSEDELMQMRVIWEGILYAESAYGMESKQFMPCAICYTLTHYGYGVFSDEHKGASGKAVTVTREQMLDLYKVAFGDDAVLYDDDAVEFFNIDGDNFTTGSNAKFRKGEFTVNSRFMSGDKLICSFKTDEKTTSLKFSFSRNPNDDSPYGIRVTEFSRIDNQ